MQHRACRAINLPSGWWWHDRLCGFSKGRLPLGFVAVGVLDGTFTGAFCVSFLPFFVTLIFSGCSSSLELVVKPQLELEGVTTLCFPVFADILSLAAFPCFSSPFSFSTASFSFSMSLNQCPSIGQRALDRFDTLPLPGLIFITNGWRTPRCFTVCCALPSTFRSSSNIPTGYALSFGVA